MEPLKNLVEAVEQIVDLKAENARLKQRLTKALDILAEATLCPDDGQRLDCVNHGPCSCFACWSQALEVSEVDLAFEDEEVT
ncbi:hypothetical protein [Desulfitobacterium chlororespirans]|uniref:Uncharacterized protein n=1 Tax=Desulfitobacterium chlororespirans DSM 11544 TaxID=1121395 RepID=A0A1M7U3U6_9FIRM|nr:hypothetical protein [Desulfitobacterium chlororespirans]SHN77584.1 hypothetical protein SAMN02745215_02907 [Desulfitobacterium chlororespirans DSM 11544]